MEKNKVRPYLQAALVTTNTFIMPDYAKNSKVELVRIKPGLTRVPAAQQQHVKYVPVYNFGRKLRNY